jgi:hypothetical protein
MSEPSRVTLAAPVAAPLDATTAVTDTPACENASDKLPTCSPADTAVTKVVASPEAPLPTTALDEVHAVASHPLPPARAAVLESDPSKLDPSKVTLAAPVVGPLLATSELTAPAPYEKAAVRLPM